MGVMTTLVMNTIVNPFKGFGRGFWNFCEVAGYARAASELARQGLHAEAKACMLQVAKLRSK
jgi:hypothetical protein